VYANADIEGRKKIIAADVHGIGGGLGLLGGDNHLSITQHARDLRLSDTGRCGQ
jgi:hypothetical protein